jgi:hypothetical protein
VSVELSFDLSSVIQVLNAVSAWAVIAGVIFVVFQLRQNARLIEASNRQLETANRQVEASIQQNKLQAMLSTIERFTDESFNMRRKKVREIVKREQENGWKAFSQSEDDFQIRGLSLFPLIKIEPIEERARWDLNPRPLAPEACTMLSLDVASNALIHVTHQFLTD